MDKDDQEHWETIRRESPTRYKESESCHSSHQPSVHDFRHRWLNEKKEVANASGIPDKGYQWISKVEDIEDPEHLQVSEGKKLLDAKVAAGLSKILHGDLAKQIQLLEEKAEAEKRLHKGRQIAWYIKDYFGINADHGAVMDFSDLIAVRMQGSDIKRYLHDWESVLLAINQTPDAVTLESLFFLHSSKKPTLSRVC